MASPCQARGSARRRYVRTHADAIRSRSATDVAKASLQAAAIHGATHQTDRGVLRDGQLGSQRDACGHDVVARESRDSPPALRTCSGAWLALACRSRRSRSSAQAVERARARSIVLASEASGELARAERLNRQIRQRREDVLRRPEHDPVEDLDQPPLPRIPGATPSRSSAAGGGCDPPLSSSTSIVRFGCDSSDGNATQLVEHRHRRRALRRSARTEHLAGARRPGRSGARPRPGGTTRIAVIVEQRVELLAERTEAARLHLDQLAVGADEVDRRTGPPAPRRRSPGSASSAFTAA